MSSPNADGEWDCNRLTSKCYSTNCCGGISRVLLHLVLSISCCIVDGHDFTRRQVLRNTAFRPWSNLVSDANISLGSSHHDFMIAVARAIGVKIFPLFTMPRQIFPGRVIPLFGFYNTIGKFVWRLLYHILTVELS